MGDEDTFDGPPYQVQQTAHEMIRDIISSLGVSERDCIVVDGSGRLLDISGKDPAPKKTPRKYRVVARCEGEKQHTEILGSSSSIITALQTYMQMRTLIEFLNPCWCGAGLTVYLEIYADGEYRVWKILWDWKEGDRCINGFKFGGKYT